MSDEEFLNEYNSIKNNIGITAEINSIREGDNVGEHRVLFDLGGESLEIIHRATDRTIFDNGAISAAKFIRHKNYGIYYMTDIVDSTI
jgi:4-hydroxy-tetrahydrodipicolinate reductase